jgi:hypothetical protein
VPDADFGKSSDADLKNRISSSTHLRKMVGEKRLAEIEKKVGQRQKNGLPEKVDGLFIMSKKVDEK